MAATSTASIKLDAEMKARIQQVATEKRRSAHWIMREAISRYVEREEQRAQFLRDGDEAFEDYLTTGLHLNGADVDDWLQRTSAGEDVPFPQCHT